MNLGLKIFFFFFFKKILKTIFYKNFKPNKEMEIDFESIINTYIIKVTNLINDFSLNVVVANVYEIFNLMNSNLEKEISNKCIKKNFSNFLKILIPFTPHLAHECLEKLGEKNIEKWPKIDEKQIKKQKIKIAIQINGKTREIIEVKKDLVEKEIINQCKKSDKINKFLSGKKIIKTIFVKNKIINYLIK